jgi:hypothetical protein
MGLTTLLLVCGCNGREAERVVVSGTITFKGEPVSEGEIRLVPLEPADSPVAGATINNGFYKVDARGGALVGTYKVEINGYRVNTAVLKRTPDAELPRGIRRGVPRLQYLPKRYNAASELRMTIEPGSALKTIDYDLKE